MSEHLTAGRNFETNPFIYPDVVETSIGPVWLSFCDTEPGEPPMINTFDVAHWRALLGDLPMEHELRNVKSSKAELHLTFQFARDGWHPNEDAPTFKVDNAELPLPSHLQDELAGHIAKWARDNQARFIRHERGQFFQQLADYGDMLNDGVEHIQFKEEVDAIIRCRWTGLVTPAALELAKQASAAMAKMQDGISQAQAAFKAIAEIGEQKPPCNE